MILVTLKTRECRFLVIVLLCVLSVAARKPANARQSSGAQEAKRAVIVSLDGLDIRYLREPDKYGLKIPTLRKLMADGVIAKGGVISVYPSVTYPNHTTMVTGVHPIKHGIYDNAVFVPSNPQLNDWAWFASGIKVETLWDSAKHKGLSTAMVSWPVSTGAGEWNIPEIWKSGTNPSSFSTTLAEMVTHQRPAGLLQEIVGRVPNIYSNVSKDEGDDMRTGFAEYLIEFMKPNLVLVHLFDLDHFQHDFGPFTPEAIAILEKSDAYVARILAALDRAGVSKETAVFIVSDHGFRPYTKQIKPNVILKNAGLITTRQETDAKGNVREVLADWRALAVVSGGASSIFLRDASDRNSLDRALVAFRAFASTSDGGPASKTKGVLRILNQREVGRAGGNPSAAFMLDAVPGYAFDRSLTGEPIVEGKLRGQHGYLPGPRDYRASFIASRAGVTRRGDIGEIRMIDIAPTVALTLDLKLPQADGRAIKLR